MKIDCHVHAAKFARKIDRAAGEAIARGVTGVVISDHWLSPKHPRSQLAFFANYERLADSFRKAGMYPYRGAEICTGYGDILLIGIPKDAPPLTDCTPQNTLRWAKEVGCLAVQAHPTYRHYLILHTDGYEVWNASKNGDLPEPELVQLCGAWGLIATAGSDTHRGGGLGRAFVELSREPKDEEDLVKLLSVERKGNIPQKGC